MKTLLKKIEQFGPNLFGWRVHKLIITKSVVKINTKISRLHHIRHGDFQATGVATFHRILLLCFTWKYKSYITISNALLEVF